MNSPQQNTHWYQHRWPWILIAIPTASVVLGVILIVTAMNNPAILVVDNYYAEGRGINRSMALDDAALQHGLSATLSVSASTIRLQLLGENEPHNIEAALNLFAYHVTDNTLDRFFVFAPAADAAASSQGFYEPATEQDLATLLEMLSRDTSWYLEIRGTENNWRLRQRISTPLIEAHF